MYNDAYTDTETIYIIIRDTGGCGEMAFKALYDNSWFD